MRVEDWLVRDRTRCVESSDEMDRLVALDEYLSAILAVESAKHPPLDLVFDVVRNHRRRWVCRYLCDVSTRTDLGTLSEFIAGIENDQDDWGVSSVERKRVYISLYQSHLPRMNDVGAVVFDADRKTVESGPHLETFDASLAFVECLLTS